MNIIAGNVPHGSARIVGSTLRVRSLILFEKSIPLKLVDNVMVEGESRTDRTWFSFLFSLTLFVVIFGGLCLIITPIGAIIVAAIYLLGRAIFFSAKRGVAHLVTVSAGKYAFSASCNAQEVAAFRSAAMLNSKTISAR